MRHQGAEHVTTMQQNEIATRLAALFPELSEDRAAELVSLFSELSAQTGMFRTVERVKVRGYRVRVTTWGLTTRSIDIDAPSADDALTEARQIDLDDARWAQEVENEESTCQVTILNEAEEEVADLELNSWLLAA